MPRLRDKDTGVVVNVDDDTAARIAAGHELVDSGSPSKKAPAKKAAAKQSKD